MNSTRRAFTLTELLVVIAIMGLLAGISIPALQGMGGPQRFTRDVAQIVGILEQARSYAIAQNTYVWVAFYPCDPSTFTPSDGSGDALFVATFASNDGTDPVNWTDVPIVMSPTAVVSGTILSPIYRTIGFRQIAIRTANYFSRGDIPSLPSGDTSFTAPSPSPIFRILVRNTGAAPLTLPASLPGDAGTGQPVSIVQFTPAGAARVGGSPVDSVWIDFQRAKAKGVLDPGNIAALRINGLTGLTTLYRK